MKEEIVFKAVFSQGRYLTSIMEKGYSITYMANRWITPRIGKIFAFISYKDAVAFIERQRLYKLTQIWKAIGKNPSEINLICSRINIKDFWETKFFCDKYFPGLSSVPSKETMRPPVGTIVVDEIKLLEKVS